MKNQTHFLKGLVYFSDSRNWILAVFNSVRFLRKKALFLQWVFIPEGAV